jgi:hypothetical protein
LKFFAIKFVAVVTFVALPRGVLYPQEQLSGRYEIIGSQAIWYYLSGNPQKYCPIHFVFPEKEAAGGVKYPSYNTDVRVVSKEDCQKLEKFFLRAIKTAKQINQEEVKPGYIVVKSNGKIQLFLIDTNKPEFLDIDGYLRSFWIP